MEVGSNSTMTYENLFANDPVKHWFVALSFIMDLANGLLYYGIIW
jgi:hypothetical protein